MPDSWDQLWKRWGDHYSSIGIDPGRICPDGILDSTVFSLARPRILFVMKDTNDYREGLPALLKRGPKFQMWHAIARWAAGLLNGLPEYEKVDDNRLMKESLARVAILNLKKATGEAGADMSVVNAYASRDRALLLQEFGLIAPGIVVACGTFDILVWLLGLDVSPDTPNEKPVLDRNHGAWIIPHRHPARANNRKSYDRLRETAGKEPALLEALPIGNSRIASENS